MYVIKKPPVPKPCDIIKRVDQNVIRVTTNAREGGNFNFKYKTCSSA